MQLVIKLLAYLYRASKTIVTLLGLLMLGVLSIYSISYLKGNTSDTVGLPLNVLITLDFVYIWIGAFIIYAIGSFVEMYVLLRKTLTKKKDIKNDTPIVVKVIKWLWAN